MHGLSQVPVLYLLCRAFAVRKTASETRMDLWSIRILRKKMLKTYLINILKIYSIKKSCFKFINMNCPYDRKSNFENFRFTFHVLYILIRLLTKP